MVFDMHRLLVLLPALAGCAHLAESEAQTAQEQASAANAASYKAALAEAMAIEQVTPLPEPTLWFDPQECAAVGKASVVLKQAAGPDLEVACDALRSARLTGDSVGAADGSATGVTLVAEPQAAFPSLLARAADGAYVHFRPQPQLVIRQMSVITPGMGCCCGSPREEPRRLWVLPGRDAIVRSVDLRFELVQVERKCDPRAPQ